MNSAQTLRDLVDAMQAGELDAARELAQALRCRLACSGFYPIGHSPQSVRDCLDSVERRIDGTGPLPAFTLVCRGCDDGEGVASEEQAMLEGWCEVAPDLELPQANFAGWCPHCRG